MNIKEAIQTAMEYEKRIQAVYRDAIEQTSDPVTRDMLQALARDEIDHLKYLQDSYRLWKETGQLIDSVLKCEIDWDEIRSSIAEAKGALSIANEEERDSILGILQKALDVEQETYNFFSKVASDLTLTERKFFDRFVKSEKDHLSLIQARIEGLKIKD